MYLNAFEYILSALFSCVQIIKQGFLVTCFLSENVAQSSRIRVFSAEAQVHENHMG
jgi:hypothetical protein